MLSNLGVIYVQHWKCEVKRCNPSKTKLT